MYKSEILHLTLKKQWFDMIASGEKTEEYREMKPYWHKRFLTKSYNFIQFRNGYAKDAPVMMVELRSISSGLGLMFWGAPAQKEVYILNLGAIIGIKNHEVNQ